MSVLTDNNTLVTFAVVCAAIIVRFGGHAQYPTTVQHVNIDQADMDVGAASRKPSQSEEQSRGVFQQLVAALKLHAVVVHWYAQHTTLWLRLLVLVVRNSPQNLGVCHTRMSLCY